MEDSFRNRVDKVFGSLVNTASSQARSLWCLTDEEVEKREWDRPRKQKQPADDDDDQQTLEAQYGPDPIIRERRPVPDIRAPMESDLLSDEEEVEDEDEETDGDGKRRRKSDGDNSVIDEDFDVKSNIGRDCTLDYEEEEDEYDKVAVGVEQAGDRMYMGRVKYSQYGDDGLNTYGELPNSFREVARDPRANHTAAKLRLQEDALTTNTSGPDNSGLETHQIKKVEPNNNPRPILKKRKNQFDSHSQKRVSFGDLPKSDGQEDQGSLGGGDPEQVADPMVDATAEVSDFVRQSSAVPDYLRNPSKYTRYSFDTSEDVNEASNRKAYMDFFHQLKKRDSKPLFPDDTTFHSTKPLVFTPKKKSEDDMMKKECASDQNLGGSLGQKGGLSGVAAGDDAEGSEACAMEEDELTAISNGDSSMQKQGRQYRRRSRTVVEES